MALPSKICACPPVLPPAWPLAGIASSAPVRTPWRRQIIGNHAIFHGRLHVGAGMICFDPLCQIRPVRRSTHVESQLSLLWQKIGAVVLSHERDERDAVEVEELQRKSVLRVVDRLGFGANAFAGPWTWTVSNEIAENFTMNIRSRDGFPGHLTSILTVSGCRSAKR